MARQQSLPQPLNIVFQHNIYDGAQTAQVGSFTYARTGTVFYADSNTTVASAATDTLMMPAYRFGGTETGYGLALNGRITNSLLRSAEFENAAWTAVGGGAGSAGTADSPVSGVDTLADTVSGGSAGDGLQQSSSVAAASKMFGFGVWLKVTSGTRVVQIKILDNTGSEGGTGYCNLTTTWFRCETAQKFDASASGNAKVQIIVGNSSDVRAWGAQLTDLNQANTGVNRTLHAYVPTTAAAVTATFDNYQIPTSIVTQVATKGSFAAWVSASRDPNDYNVAGGLYLMRVKATDSELAVLFRNAETIGLYLNNTLAAESTLFNTWQRDYWDHYVFTWDTVADVYKVYKNSVEVGTGSGSLAAAAVGTNAMFIGSSVNDNDFGLDGRVSQVILWKNALTAAEVAQVYASKAPLFAPPAYDTGKIFSVQLSNSLIPTVGPRRFWYHTPGKTGYYDSTTTYAESAIAGLPLPAYGFNSASSQPGMAFNSQHRNRILQSEAPATTWTAIVNGAAPTITNAVGTFVGTIAYGTIDGGSGDGIQQPAAGPIAANSQDFQASVYASVAASTLDFQLCLEGDSGGTPDTDCETKTATTTVQRFVNYTALNAARTGNIRMKILLSATGVLRVGGMTLNVVSDSEEDPSYKSPTDYVKTVAATALHPYNFLVYPNERAFNPNKGTLIAWAMPFFSSADCIAPTGPTWLSSTGNSFEFYTDIGSLSDMKLSYGLAGGTPVLGAVVSIVANTWYQWVYTWDNTVSPAQFSSYQNGTLIESQTASRNPMSPKNFMIGNMSREINTDKFAGPVDYWNGIIDKVDVYGSALDAAAIDADCEANKATYGVATCGP